MSVARRTLLKGAAASALAAPMLNFGTVRAFAQAEKYSSRAVSLVERSLVIDMLGVPELLPKPDVFIQKLTPERVAAFRDSGITAFHCSYGVGGPDAYQQVLQVLQSWSFYAGHNAELWSLVGRAEDLDAAKKQKKVAMILGVQNAEHFRTVADVKSFYQLGLRCSQLTYNSQNRIGSGSTDRVDGGVSDFGEAIIKAMNEVGMLVDVSHCGDRTTLDAIEISPKPIAITHSNCRALNNHPRVKTDEAIKKLAAKGGVMGITGVRMFVSDKEPTTIEHMVDHIDHVVKLVGIEHVGIGSDADLNGYDKLPPEVQKKLRESYKSSYAFRDKIDIDGFNHPKKVYDLTEVLIRRKYSDANIEAILGGNFRRLLGATWL
jgi:membrane dipeptidase